MSASSLQALGNIHHAAYRCRDAEQTRWFYEDVMGLRLAAAFEDEIDVGEGGRGNRHFLHIFFEMADGNYLAFFDEPNFASEEKFLAKDSFDMHIALETENLQSLAQWQARLDELGVPCMGPIDHDFVHSIYMLDPNGIPLEITARVDDSVRVMQNNADSARANLAAWSEKTRELKLEKLNKEALDKRF
ncbi:MAG TPA: glyoxalase [Spongiibacteraceae bacterium]|nr:glyoxalase [Spongiibacteraceae bacterium]HCS28104.1 glyoxalase [Spongiibacteraceae bacterium]|tara:strand:- start:178 stop:744 length:567 start_codon:yes stop_codon:yes gene_type:complete